MFLRRTVALLSSLAMLHLTVVVGEASCVTAAEIGAHGAPAEMTTADAHDHHVAPAASMAAVQADAPPADQPATQQCCEAMIACGVATDIAQARVLVADARAPSMQSSMGAPDAPASFVAPPEPPPPKA